MKDIINLSTDKGTNVLSLIGAAALSANQLPEGNLKTFILTLLSFAGCVVLYLIRGENHVIDESVPLEDVLKEGRDED